nr:hypothetical protein [uncultured organism]
MLSFGNFAWAATVATLTEIDAVGYGLLLTFWN